MMRERRDSKSPWNYNLSIVAPLEHPENAHVNLDFESYTLMAYELADTIKIENPFLNKIVFLPDSSYLASYVSNNSSINFSACISPEEDLEDLHISSYDKVLLLANENRNGEVMGLCEQIKTMFSPQEIVVGVLFEHPDVAKKADFAVYETSYRVNYPVEAKMDHISHTELLLAAGEEIAYLLLPGGNEMSLDWKSAAEEFSLTNTNLNLPISLNDYHFASIMLFALRDRYKTLFNKQLPDKIARLMLPGIIDEVFKSDQ